MAQDVRAGSEKEKVKQPADEPREFDVDFIISRMKEVGYINSEGYTVLPKYYDDE